MSLQHFDDGIRYLMHVIFGKRGKSKAGEGVSFVPPGIGNFNMAVVYTGRSSIFSGLKGKTRPAKSIMQLEGFLGVALRPEDFPDWRPLGRDRFDKVLDIATQLVHFQRESHHVPAVLPFRRIDGKIEDLRHLPQPVH